MQWQQELLDLTNRNRLLNFRFSPSRPSSLQLIAPQVDALYALLQTKSALVIGNDPPEKTEDSEESQDAAAALAELSEPPRITKPGTALSSMPSDRTNRVALRLLARARSSEQEQGINILFAVFGLLKWQEKPGEETWRYAPLVMLPLKIEERAREGSFLISAAGEDPEFNQTLGERLKSDFGLTLDVSMDEETSLADVFSEVRAAVAKQSGWEVLDQAHVGLFQFHKLRMFTDIGEHIEVFSQHEIVQALASDGARIAPLPEGIPNEDELDRAVPPLDSFTVLDADASQLRAIQAAARGGHLIIEGPPGTGKSQTIANIIAECIAAGKTVLFVSEKAAAMEVVHRRLSERGLGDLCLMLHSQKANKRDVIHDLGARLIFVQPPVSTAQEELNLRRLQETREQLNAYPEALHRRRNSLGESAFWAHGQLASLRDVPYLTTLPPALDDLTHERLEAWETRLNQVSRYAPILAEGSSHPWAGINRKEMTLADQETLRHTLTSLRAAMGEIQTESPRLAGQLSLPGPNTMQEARNLAKIAGGIPLDRDLQSRWFDPNRIQETESLAKEATGQAGTLRDLTDRVFATYKDEIISAATPEAIATYERGRFARLFSSSHRRIRAQVRSAAKDGQQRSIADELSSLRDARLVNQHLAWFREREAKLSETVGLSLSREKVPEPDVWKRRADDISATAAMLIQLPTGPVPFAFVEEVCRPGTGAKIALLHQRLDAAIARVDGGLATLHSYFESSGLQIEEVPLSIAHLDTISGWIDLRLSRLHDLDVWLHAQSSFRQAKSDGLDQVIGQLFAQEVPPEDWVETFRRLVLTHWIDHVYREDEVLRTFRGDEHATAIARFKELDHSFIDTSMKRIRQVLATRQTRVSDVHGGEPGTLKYEAAKRRRHMPLRRLFERIPNLLPTLKPCLMMSPLSVAHFLPANLYHFDVVIFDEASQVRPCDAIGAIVRGKQLVVAGDNQQLPPTTFFDRTVGDGELDEDQNVGALESILESLRVKEMPPQQLLWHYRSRHEDLISFSNHHIYMRRLITFPSSAAHRSPTRGVRLEYVPNARYEDEQDRVLKTSFRVNREEARRVATLVLHHARTRPKESLGVVALGLNQADVVEEEIKQARVLDRSLDDFFRLDKHEPFFVKALEQVQGDERDVIMISIGYGKNAQGVLSHNFGPINRDGGYRRLNVLVTRAKHQVIVVSSIRAGDIDQTKSEKLGPRLLKNYLDFAERGQIALEAEMAVGDDEADSPFEIHVGEALKRAGFIVHRQVGCSKYRIDLGIVDPHQPGSYLLGIECDGATYHRSKTARDRDRLRQEVLEQLGWNIHRIWSTEWIRQPERELDRVIARVNQLLNGRESDANGSLPTKPDFAELDRKDAVPDTMTEVSQVQVLSEPSDVQTPLTDESASQLTTPYRIVELSVVGYGDILSTPLHFIANAVTSCVEFEGPIHRDLLARRITAAWGFARAGARIGARIDEAISAAIRQGHIRRKGVFLWPSVDPEIVPRGPAMDGTDRDINHIPNEELMRGMKIVLEHALSLTEDELVMRTARLFGYQRTGSEIDRRMRETIRSAWEEGTFEAKDSRYQLGRLSIDRQ
ncbi:MAG: DUF3320 domain-containing protein [Thermomicrobiales bacterium]